MWGGFGGGGLENYNMLNRTETEAAELAIAIQVKKKKLVAICKATIWETL